MKKLTVLLLLFVACQIMIGQNYKFGKISKDELLEKIHPLEKEAHAAILYKNQNISFDYRLEDGFVQINEIHERIKIYDKEGFDWATKVLKLYNGSNDMKEKVLGLKAYTYNLIEGKIKKEKLTNQGVFDEERNKYWRQKSFTMPNIKEGSIIEYKYKIETPFMRIDDIYLQHTIPIKKMEMKVAIPEYFVFSRTLNPKASYFPKLIVEKINKTEQIQYREKTGIVSSSVSTSDMKYIEHKTSTSLINVPALKIERFVDNLDNYTAKLVWEYVMYKGPNGAIKNYAKNWEQVAKTIYKDGDFGVQLKKTTYYSEEINNLIKDISDPLQRAGLIFNFVKSRVKWNGYVGFSTELGVRKALKEGVGNTADINLMLTSMLRFAGLKANPVLVSTKNNGIPLFPTRSGFNYVISIIETANGMVLLDATEKFAKANVLPKRTLNWQGRVVREDGTSEWVKLVPNKSSVDMKSINYKINNDLSVEGKIRNQLTFHNALSFRNEFENLNEEQHIEFLEKNNGEMVVSDLSITNENDLSKNILRSYNFTVADQVESIGDHLYISPLLFFAPDESFFKEEERHYPIDFVHPFTDKFMVNVMIPEGYDVESIPENQAIILPENQGSFSYLIKKNGKYLQLNIAFNYNSAMVMADQYDVFRMFYNTYVTKSSEKIVLKKIQP